MPFLSYVPQRSCVTVSVLVPAANRRRAIGVYRRLVLLAPLTRLPWTRLAEILGNLTAADVTAALLRHITDPARLSLR
jgi:hypothetical protein